VLTRFHDWWVARGLADRLQAHSKNGTCIDPLSINVGERPRGRYGVHVVASCIYPADPSFTGRESIVMADWEGFRTVQGAVGRASEVSAFLVARLPNLNILLWGYQTELRRFNSKDNTWQPLPERSWKCSKCGAATVWPSYTFAASTDVAWCEGCEVIMREVRSE
jgi:hypothetical protein